MIDHLNREKYLRQLLEDNFAAAKICRRLIEFLSDPALKQYFQKMAARRSQYAMEISEEISFFGGKAPYVSSTSYDNILPSLKGDNLACLKHILKLNKKSLGQYKLALSQINDGSCREVIMRHKAYIENSLFELKGLKALLKFRQKHQKNVGRQGVYNDS